jgi:hypothetical protein
MTSKDNKSKELSEEDRLLAERLIKGYENTFRELGKK